MPRPDSGHVFRRRRLRRPRAADDTVSARWGRLRLRSGGTFELCGMACDESHGRRAACSAAGSVYLPLAPALKIAVGTAGEAAGFQSRPARRPEPACVRSPLPGASLPRAGQPIA